MNADKMFEELGFRKLEDTTHIKYKKDIGSIILYVSFNKLKFGHGAYMKDNVTGESEPLIIRGREHLAIHEKMKELGWI